MRRAPSVASVAPVEVLMPGPTVTIPSEELQEALWQGLLVRVKYWDGRAAWAREHHRALLDAGPDGDHPYRNNPPQVRRDAWKSMVDDWSRQESRALKMAEALRELHAQMEGE